MDEQEQNNVSLFFQAVMLSSKERYGGGFTPNENLTEEVEASVLKHYKNLQALDDQSEGGGAEV